MNINDQVWGSKGRTATDREQTRSVSISVAHVRIFTTVCTFNNGSSKGAMTALGEHLNKSEREGRASMEHYD